MSDWVHRGLDDEQATFVGEVRELLAEVGRIDGYFADSTPEQIEGIRAVHRALGGRGWLSLSWPTWAGGSAKHPIFEYLLWNEMAYSRAARPPLAAGIVAKTIMLHGSTEQRERYLPGIRSGHLAFSLGYSEPEAGSDLGGLRTRATLDGDTYVVGGEKRWTSGAHWADQLWLLCRTGTLESRSRGLTILIVDMASEGVTVRRLPTIDGGTLNEVVLDDVRVPVANRIGDENGGWRLIVGSLAVERHVQFPPGRLQRDLDDIADWAVDTGRAGDPMVRRALARMRASIGEAEATALLVLDAIERGDDSVGLAAVNKLVHADACQELARIAAELGGPGTLVRGHDIEAMWSQSILETIGGGTTEIMLGVAARELLRIGSE